MEGLDLTENLGFLLFSAILGSHNSLFIIDKQIVI